MGNMVCHVCGKGYDPADVEIAKDTQKQMAKQGHGIADMIRKQLDKADKPAAKKSEKKAEKKAK